MKNHNRRSFLKDSLTITLGSALSIGYLNTFAQGISGMEKLAGPYKFSQVKLPYTYASLEPHIDAATMEIHYTKHHTSYIKNVNEAIDAEKLQFKDAKEFFANASRLSAKARNNGGGAWNHNFFWESMKAGGTQAPTGRLKTAIEKSFGSIEKFKEQFSQAASTRFGSGWAWLVNDKGTLKITSTPNQDNPLMDNAEVKGTPLLALDVWEHAYYLKYQNKRADYITAWWNVVNWNEVAKRFV